MAALSPVAQYVLLYAAVRCGFSANTASASAPSTPLTDVARSNRFVLAHSRSSVPEKLCFDDRSSFAIRTRTSDAVVGSFRHACRFLDPLLSLRSSRLAFIQISMS